MLHEFMDGALDKSKSYSQKWLTQFMIESGGYILSPEKIREKF